MSSRRRIHVPPRIALRLAGYFAACWGTIAVAVRDAAPWAPWLVLGLAVYTTLPLVFFLRNGGWPFYPRAAFRILVVRVFLYVNLALPLVAAASLLGLLAAFALGAPSMGRRAAALVALMMLALYVAGYIGSRRLRIRRLTVRLPTLPPAFEGTRIAQICDLHIGPHTRRRFLRRVAEAVSAFEPDLIAIPGDLVDDRHEDVGVLVERLGRFTAPLGVFLSPGNHEVYQGWPRVASALRDAGIGTLLVNDSRLVRRGDAAIAIVGTGDPSGHMTGNVEVQPNVDRALAKVPVGMTTIALAHNPAVWPQLAERGVALTLSGHTHAGQFAIGKWNMAAAFLELSLGPYRRGDALLYISPGTGHWGIPFRVGAAATGEVTVITLERGAPAIVAAG